MYSVVTVRRLRIRSVELVGRIGHIPVRRALVRLTSPPPAKRLVGMVESPPHRREALAAGLVEPAVRLGAPEPVFLRDQLLDLLQDRLLVYTASITSLRLAPGRRALSRRSCYRAGRRCASEACAALPDRSCSRGRNRIPEICRWPPHGQPETIGIGPRATDSSEVPPQRAQRVTATLGMTGLSRASPDWHTVSPLARRLRCLRESGLTGASQDVPVAI